MNRRTFLKGLTATAAGRCAAVLVPSSELVEPVDALLKRFWALDQTMARPRHEVIILDGVALRLPNPVITEKISSGFVSRVRFADDEISGDWGETDLSREVDTWADSIREVMMEGALRRTPVNVHRTWRDFEDAVHAELDDIKLRSVRTNDPIHAVIQRASNNRVLFTWEDAALS